MLKMKKSKVLMIEDDTNVSKLITDYLTKQGFDVTGFGSLKINSYSNGGPD